MAALGHHIGGKRISATSDRTGSVFNPATGRVSQDVAFASSKDVELAVSTAKSAFADWANTPPLRRARVMFRYLELLEKHKSEIAALITAEHGKVLSDAAGEVVRGIEVVEFATGIPHLMAGHFTENVGSSVDSWAVRQPLGVCLGITPFNFPAMVPMWMFPVALACGNTFILKPSEKVPSASMMLADLLYEAGLPAGCFNVVNGDRSSVEQLLAHPDISAVSFVGSTPVAKAIQLAGIQQNKRVQALGGAKNHAIIMPDADMDTAISGLMGAAYGSAGERCMAISVAVAVGGIADRLVERLADEAHRLKVRPGTDPEAEMGPLVTSQHLQRVSSYIDIGLEEGADLVVDGRGVQGESLGDGFFIGPSLFDNVKPDMRIYREEIFGPVLSVVRAENADEAFRLVNEHEFGNGTAIFTNSGETGRRFVNEIQAGMVGVNVPIPVPVAYHSFGGWKSSLFGDHHMYGPEGVRFFTKLKTVTSRWPRDEQARADYTMPVQG
ncbi:MAG TPA: CoA-acylating methylmalonate-semialdehyde dehydrogenase [Hyphomicrobiaceae bacterium]|nr:CoA-acylating methylmalonate-semialdehyde dehydrogenase [Hyphomicrobiaceae bacterium]